MCPVNSWSCEIHPFNLDFLYKLRHYDIVKLLKSFYEGEFKTDGMTTREVAEKWRITPRQVQHLCARGHIPRAERFGNAWVIPLDAKKPEDRRVKKIKRISDHDYWRI